MQETEWWCDTTPAESLERQFFYDESFRKPFVPPKTGFAGRPEPYLRTEQVAGRYDKKARPRTNCEIWKAYERLPDHQVREAVRRNVARSKAHFERRLVRLARTLKAIHPGESSGQWAEVVEVWLFLSRQHGMRWTKTAVQSRFAQAHTDASGRPPGDRIAERAKRHGGGDIVKALVAVSRFLKSRQFFASARKVAEWIGVSSATAARRLSALVATGGVRVVQAGSPHVYGREATVYDVSPLFALCDHEPRSSRTLNARRLLGGITGASRESFSHLEPSSDLPMCLTDSATDRADKDVDAFTAFFDGLDGENLPEARDVVDT